MDPFQDKIGGNSPRNRENKIYCSVPFRSNPTHNRNSKKIAKKFKKLKSIIMDSFQAIIGWKWMRKRKNKNFLHVSFLPNA